MKALKAIVLLNIGLAFSTTPALAGGNDKWRPHAEATGKLGTVRSTGETGLFAPLLQGPDSLLFADVRARLASDPSLEGNFGIGYRHALRDAGMIVGGYGFFDLRRTESGNLYRQFTVGGEVMGESWSFRANAYLPENRRNRVGEDGTATAFSPRFEISDGHLFVIEGMRTDNTRYEVPYRGVDGEISRRLDLGLPVGLWAYAGGYHFWAEGGEPITGPRGRLEARIDDLFPPCPDHAWRSASRSKPTPFGAGMASFPPPCESPSGRPMLPACGRWPASMSA